MEESFVELTLTPKPHETMTVSSVKVIVLLLRICYCFYCILQFECQRSTKHEEGVMTSTFHITFVILDSTKTTEQQDADVMVTGRVVGVLQRNTRDYVVAIPDDECKIRSSRVCSLFSEFTSALFFSL